MTSRERQEDSRTYQNHSGTYVSVRNDVSERRNSSLDIYHLHNQHHHLQNHPHFQQNNQQNHFQPISVHIPPPQMHQQYYTPFQQPQPPGVSSSLSLISQQTENPHLQLQSLPRREETPPFQAIPFQVPINSGEEMATAEQQLRRFVSTEQKIHHGIYGKSSCTTCNCLCFVLACLVLMMILMSGIYYGLNYFDGKNLRERVFKAQFIVQNQEFLSHKLENSESKEFKQLSEMLKTKIDRLFLESTLRQAYVKNEIVAFEKKRDSSSDVIIHFNLYISATKQSLETSDIYMVLAEEIANNRLKIFDHLIIDHHSIFVQERRWVIPVEKSSFLYDPWTHRSVFPGIIEGLSTEPTPPPRKCRQIDLSYCRFVSYNLTSYPNFFNHWNVSSVEDEFILYKELIDSECYSLAKEFLCNLLQPECNDDEMVLPCQEFCQEFVSACSRWIPEQLSNKISCQSLISSKQQQPITGQTCRNKPNCATTFRLQSQFHKICDGIRDCGHADDSDESQCSYCENWPKQFHCGNKQCVTSNAICDGIKDCQTGADEAQCLSFIDKINDDDHGGSGGDENRKNHSIRMNWNIYKGFLRANYKGQMSYVCSDQTTMSLNNGSNHLQNHQRINQQERIMGINVCNENNFQELIRIESRPASIDNNGPFTRFVPGTSLISPYLIQCKNRNIYYVECSAPKCGISQIPNDQESWNDFFQTKKSWPGYWPWFVKIMANGNYFCDGTLVSVDTILTQSTCLASSRSLLTFIKNNQDGEIRNISVVLGSARFLSENYETAKHSVDVTRTKLMKASFTQNENDEQQNLALLKLTNPVSVTRFIRPICFHNTKDSFQQQNQNKLFESFKGQRCAVLNLNYELDELQYQQVKVVDLEQCKQQLQRTKYEPNTSSSSLNSDSEFRFDEAYFREKLCVRIDKQDDFNYYGDSIVMENFPNSSFKVSTASTTLSTISMINVTTTTTTATILGRHLYCSNKNIDWHLIAIEHRMIQTTTTMTTSSSSNQSLFQDQQPNKSFILFQMIQKLEL